MEDRELIAVRHGESLSNVLMPLAETAGWETAPELPAKDADVPLTERGIAQARQLGRFLAEPGNRPTAVLSSPFARARATCRHAAEGATAQGVDLADVRIEPRVSERDMGVLQLLTSTGKRRRHPREHAGWQREGLHCYRPSGGENFEDVIARVRHLVAELRTGTRGARVLVVTHDAVVLALRALAEGRGMTELGGIPLVSNCSVSRWRLDADGRLHSRGYGQTGHLVATPS
ncbi:histidine phosphatase family protein [Mangrovactinospora gilvigrisea]|uniref:histidine phosphatase family protein n=1 Tax=Mangrovactinospora gilvigrisea TaxID=1428644 RepID=UPI000AA930A2|nr:histidine phosphatase family protein [Mangrovactinospora gilvigrisea]